MPDELSLVLWLGWIAQNGMGLSGLLSMEISAVIYILDDDPFAADIASQIVSLKGFENRAFTNAESFKNAVLDRKPDLVILDIAMPDTDGIEVLHWLSENSPGSRVMLVSGHSIEFLDMARSYADAHHVTVVSAHVKPVDVSKMADEVASALS